MKDRAKIDKWGRGKREELFAESTLRYRQILIVVQTHFMMNCWTL